MLFFQIYCKMETENRRVKMKDPEFIELRNRFLFSIFICLVFLIPLFFFFSRKMTPGNSKILQRIKKEETFLVLITEKKCSTCKIYEQELKDRSVDYLKSNKDNDRNYQRILERLNLSEEDITPPALLYIKKGTLDYMIIHFNEEEMHDFLNTIGSE